MASMDTCILHTTTTDQLTVRLVIIAIHFVEWKSGIKIGWIKYPVSWYAGVDKLSIIMHNAQEEAGKHYFTGTWYCMNTLKSVLKFYKLGPIRYWVLLGNIHQYYVFDSYLYLV